MRVTTSGTARGSGEIARPLPRPRSGGNTLAGSKARRHGHPETHPEQRLPLPPTETARKVLCWSSAVVKVTSLGLTSSNDLSVTPLILQYHYGRGVQPEHSLDFKRTRMGVFVKSYQEKRNMEFYPWPGPVAGVSAAFLSASSARRQELWQNPQPSGTPAAACSGRVAFCEEALTVLLCEAGLLSGFRGGQQPRVCVRATCGDAEGAVTRVPRTVTHATGSAPCSPNRPGRFA